jgi:mRNA interferase MazF
MTPIMLYRCRPDRARYSGNRPVVKVASGQAPRGLLLPAAETGLDRDSKAQAEQVRSIAVDQVGDRLGVVTHVTMFDIDEALRLHLGP